MDVRLFGVRHHGPGSARSLVTALDELQPTAVLVELRQVPVLAPECGAQLGVV